MNRDGANKSIWQESTGFIANPIQHNNGAFDVIIAGGGMTGLVTGLLLQQAGKKCLIAEARTIGFGTTAGTTAHLNTFLDTSYSKIESNFDKKDAELICTAAKQAISLVEKNIQQQGIDCGYSRKDGYLFSQDSKQSKELDDILESSLRAGCTVEYSSSLPIDSAYEKVLKFSEQAQFNPGDYLYGIANAFQKAGGAILEDCRVTAFKGDDLLEVETFKGTFQARAVILATHIPMGVNLLHFRCAPYRSYAMAMTLEDEAYPDALVYDMYDPYHYYRTQEVNGMRYLIAGGEDHKTAHEENTEACFKKLEADIRRHFKIKEVAYKWSSQYFEPTDGLPYIGHLPGNPENVLVGTGYGGNGMIYSHVAAQIFSDMLNGVNNDLIELLDPNRIKPVAGFTEFVKESADVAGNFLAKFFPKDKLNTLSELAHGEARVVKYDAETMGIYKDESGEVHAVNPSCTHVNCQVGWNNTERSWDCPCHGARYNIDGEMITGPARKDLQKINLEKED